ncbi:hypothetical protein EMPS_05994 [Entomortierella parvispora]|uniref:Protein Zds1 C-terminal domain-containing protein n=1 Tax=Entomortierella parvispora TaxID=205924 RepID=A0A9P3HBP4_9FUNG|nr:hypothetical protein EMPS_05994 [Entomortierella parvispora]
MDVTSIDTKHLATLPPTSQTDLTPSRPRNPSVGTGMARNRREAIALDGLMFESSTVQGAHESSGPMDPESENGSDITRSEPSDPSSDISAGALSDNGTLTPIDTSTTTTGANRIDSNRSMLSSTSSASSSSSLSPSPTTTSDLPSTFRNDIHQDPDVSLASLSPPVIRRSVSQSKRQSMFLGEHIIISQDGPEAEASSSIGSDGQEDMKEVQIETEDPSHLFWVPFHLHPEIAPNEYNKWLLKHGVESTDTDGVVSSRSPSISRRKSVLSAQYNPEDDQDEPPSVPENIVEETGEHDFLSGVFSAPLEQMGEPPLKTKTSLRRSVSLSVSSPTKDHFPADVMDEDITTVKRPGGLERGGLSLLRRSARTKIRRNSTASNDTRNDVSRLRQTVNANGEYPAVKLVDNGPTPRPAPEGEDPASTSTDGVEGTRDTSNQPLKRFVSTLRDSSKPTITTYLEPHLLEQQRREAEDSSENKDDEESTPSFRISAPGKLENTTAVSLLEETIENDRRERQENFAVSYPIPPPVKLTQNLLQQPSSQPSPPTPMQPGQVANKNKQPGTVSPQGVSAHSKKPSTWSWLWGKEKGAEKSMDPNGQGAWSTPTSTAKQQTTTPAASSIDTNTQMLNPAEITVKKQSTLSMLFSRNGKSTSKTQATTAENNQSVTVNGYSGQGFANDRPKYSNYNRLPIHIERAIYRLSHVKLANPRRPLHEQVLISNMMFWYLGVIQQQQLLQQQADLQQQQLLEQQLQQQQQQQQKRQQRKQRRSKSQEQKSSVSKHDKESRVSLQSTDEEGDDVPLGHYQNMPRQAVPVS